MGLEIGIVLTRAAKILDEAWGWAKRGMWLYCIAHVEGAIQLLAVIDDIIQRTQRDLEPDEETRYVAIRENIHNVLQEAARIGGNGREGATKMSGVDAEEKKNEFKSLVRYMIAQNSPQ